MGKGWPLLKYILQNKLCQAFQNQKFYKKNWQWFYRIQIAAPLVGKQKYVVQKKNGCITVVQMKSIFSPFI